MVWEDYVWHDRRMEQPEMASRLAGAGLEPTGWCNGKPSFDGEIDWELVQAICDGDLEASAPASKTKGRKRK